MFVRTFHWEVCIKYLSLIIRYENWKFYEFLTTTQFTNFQDFSNFEQQKRIKKVVDMYFWWFKIEY